MKDNDSKNDFNDFLERLRNWMQEKGDQESRLLLGELLEWGTAVLKHESSDFNMFDMIREKIKNSAKKSKRSEKELLDYLFESGDHDTWILRLQLLGVIKEKEKK